MSCGVGRRHVLDPMLLWLWHRPAATALIGPLAWESPCAAGVAIEKTKRQKTNKQTNKQNKQTKKVLVGKEKKSRERRDEMNKRNFDVSLSP